MSFLKPVAMLLSGTAVCVAAAAPATAQSATQAFAIPAGTLKSALRRWMHQTGRELIYREGDLEAARSAGVTGTMTPEDALVALLEGNGFTLSIHSSGAIAIVRGESEGNATPEILVTGVRNWSLNTGIARSRDDSQPFIVMTQEDIKRSGAPDLDTFLRNQLNVNSAPTAGDQAGRTNTFQRGLSNINLRGLGSRDTLILVDGRRQPGVNLGNGQMNQPQITGIPLASIERIEVLASSASGIYGSGASGGVINIILRRGFQGAELTANYANTTDLAQADRRIDFTGAKTLEGGRTNISLTASWRKQDPLLYGDRVDLLSRGRDRIIANAPDDFDYLVPTSAATSNIRSVDGSPLQLKPQYGGTLFNSAIAHVSNGYRGVALDGIAPLVATVGQYNFDQPDSATGVGRRAPLLYGSENLSGTLAARRLFNDWLTVYAEVGASRVISRNVVSRSPSNVTLSPDIATNPFTQAIDVTLPQVGADSRVSTRNDQVRGVVGAIVKLPYHWQAVADLSWSKSRFASDRTASNTDVAFSDSLANGTQDVLRDLRTNPLNYSFIDSGFGTFITPAVSRVATQSLRLAGPVPFKLPGGAPRMTINLERSLEVSGSSYWANNGSLLSSVTYTPGRTQTTLAAYGEIAFPIFSEQNHLPLLRTLELRISARHERYRGDGALANIACQFVGGPLASDDVLAGCPAPGADMGIASTRNSHTDPSFSFRWAPIRDITFRGSYSTGYLPPTLDQLTKMRSVLGVIAKDPLRGGEAIGTPGAFGNEIDAYSGGNPNVRPETSRTFTFGAILTPRFLSGLRFSADWTHIRKRDNYFSPAGLLYATDDATQRALEIFMARYPDRVQRGPASGGYAVGPITSIDVSMANLVGSDAEAVDFALDYSDRLFGGTIDFSGSATWVRELSIQTFPGVPGQEYAGVNTQLYAQGYADNGALRWRGNGSVRWSKGAVTLSWQSRYTDGYYLQLDRSFVPRQGSAKVDSQLYHDIAFSYRIDPRMTVRGGVNNILGSKPPIDTFAAPVFYSSYGDPRLTNFYLNVTRSF